MVLPDTSIWIAYLRPGSPEVTDELHRGLDRGEVLVCGPVLAELTAGVRTSDREPLLSTLAALPWADLDRSAWQRVGLLAAELRDRGELLPLTDLEIAVAAHTADATLWTTDSDFVGLQDLIDGFELRLEPPTR